MNKITIILLGIIVEASALYAENLGLPNDEVLEQNMRAEGVISNALPASDPADFEEPASGNLRQHERKQILELQEKLEVMLQNAPENLAWRKGAEEVLIQLSVIKQNRQRNEFLKVIPALLSSYREVTSVEQEEEITTETKYLSQLDQLAQLVHGEIYRLVKEKNAVLTADEWSWVSQMSLYCSLWSMGYWENRSDYLLSDGAFLIDPEKAAAELKTKGLTQVSSFLAGHENNDFFERYEEAGDGMTVLKAKYLANKAAIQAKFAEVLAYAADLEGQSK